MRHGHADILILSEAYCTHTRRWAAALTDRGLRVAVLSTMPAAPIEGVQTLRFEVPAPSLKYPARWLGRYQKAMSQHLDRLKPRLVHMHFLDDWRLDRPALGERPLVISTWGSDVMSPDESPDVHHRKAGLLQLADRVTATTPLLAQATARYAGLAFASIAVIPFGVDVARFVVGRAGEPTTAGWRPSQAAAPAALNADRPPTVGFLKHLRPTYGPDVLLRAFRLVLDRVTDARLLIVGEGPMRSDLEALAAELKISHAVEWCGAIGHEEVPAAYAAMDVYVMPSRQEAFGVTALEAQAAGVPVVASDLPGVRQAVAPDAGASALLVPPEDPAALADAILRLLADRDLRQRMGLAGRQFVADHFQWSQCVDRMTALYETLLEKHD